MPKLKMIAMAALAMVTPSMAAAETVMLHSAVYVERTEGRSRVVLEAPRTVARGDKLVFIVAYRNTGTTPAANVVVTNPLPGTIAYQGAGDPAMQVSVDGGRRWGRIEQLTVTDADGTRQARPEDVTHLRWAMKGLRAGSGGRLSFRGIVR